MVSGVFCRVWRTRGPATPSVTSSMEIVMIALLGDLVRRRGLRRHGAVRAEQGAAAAAFLRLPGGVPSHDTFSRMFRLLDPLGFEACFARYLAALSRTGPRRGRARRQDGAPLVRPPAGRAPFI